MTSRTVIAVVTDAIYPFHQGGKEIRYHELLPRLATQADVHVYTMRWWPGPRTRTVDGVTYHAISKNFPLYAKGRRSLSQAALFGLACTQLIGRRFDVIEADHIPYVPVYVLRLVSWLRRRPLVVTWHEVWGKEAWTDYLGHAGRLAWLVERGAMRLPDTIVAASTQTADRLSGYVGPATEIVVAHSGLDLELIERCPASTDHTDLVFVGRLLAHKGVDLIIDSIALLAEHGSHVTCRVIGQGPEGRRLHERARARAVDHLIDFRDDVDEPEQLYSLIKASDIFVFPSTREGFGLAVAEALACGLPVITTNHPDNLARFLVDSPQRGEVCSPTAEAVAAAIQRLLPARGNMAEKHQPGLANKVRPADLASYDWANVTARVAQALGVSGA